MSVAILREHTNVSFKETGLRFPLRRVLLLAGNEANGEAPRQSATQVLEHISREGPT